MLVGGPESIEREKTEDAIRAMHQQFTATLEGLARQKVELQNELAQSRQQAANELAALRQEVLGAPLRGTQATGVGVDTPTSQGRKTRGETGAQCSRGTLVHRYHVYRS